MSLDATRWAWCLNVTPSQKLLLLSLADRADEHHRCWPSLTRLSKDTGLDERTINTALRQLCEDGLVVRVETPGRGYTYTLIGVSGREDNAPANIAPTSKVYPPQNCTPCKNAPPPPSKLQGTPPQNCISHHKKESTNESTKNLPSRAGAREDVPRDFEAFWKAFPKKTGKKAALKAWKNARDKPGIDVILAAIEHQRASPQWQRDGGQYIPNPATWLNQGRWEDQPVEMAAIAFASREKEARAFVLQYGEGDREMERKALAEFCRSKKLNFAEYAPILSQAAGAPC